MTKQIFKYPLQVTDTQFISMPEGAEILTVQVQRDAPCLWALVDQKLPDTTRHIETFGTGQPVDIDAGIERKYIGTYQLCYSTLVFHVFERIQ